MNLRARLAAANRLQRSRAFKIIATAVLLLAAVVVFTTYVVRQTAPLGIDGRPRASESIPASPDGELNEDQIRARETFRSALKASENAVEQVLSQQSDWKSVGFGVLVVTGLALTVVWLGLGLTYLVLLGFAAVVGFPLARYEPTAGAGQLLLGIVALTASFTALLQLVRMLLGHAGPVCAIAKVVLDEAVRMKISLVFIVVLMIGLSALPNALDAEQPLRYRVQSFMSFGTGLSFWTIAVLTLLFAAATVAFEQRDKIIWQTVTKPVSAWKYVLGKWLGVCALNAVLLAVCASGIFLFVEYLRGQPALGEREAFVSLAKGEGDLTEDRWILETQVLSARVTVENDPPFTKSSPEFVSGVEQFIRARQETDPQFGIAPGERATIVDDLFKNAITQYRSIEPGERERFVFHGLGKARDRGELLLFRFRIDAGSNRPDEFYDVSYLFSDGSQLVKRMGLGFFHSTTVYPTAIYRVTDADRARVGDDPEMLRELEKLDGALMLDVVNANVETRVANASTITFPPGGLEFSYRVGSYRMNFVRAMLVLWAKLAFLAIVAIWAATFLSFPVACVVAFGVLLAAEGSGFLRTSLETFATSDRKGNVEVFNLIASGVTRVVAGAFSLYGDLKPTKRLVQGELIPLGSVFTGGAFIATASGALYLVTVITMRRRELAIYSGQ